MAIGVGVVVRLSSSGAKGVTVCGALAGVIITLGASGRGVIGVAFVTTQAF